VSKLPVLMYHNITPNNDLSLGLTLSASKFEEQLDFLNRNNYTSLFVSELEQMQSIAAKSVVVTFDDVTENQLLYALPLLKKHNIKATFFIPFSYIGKTDLWNNGSEKIMTIEELKSLDSSIIELGHHSFYHRKYSDLSEQEIEDDFDKSFDIITKNNLNVYPSLAYPYGNFPKKRLKKDLFFTILEKKGIKMAFRIGNRVNIFPVKNKFEMQRIDIKGQDTLFKFKWKLKVGKLSLF
jgi:peptidoglycan/xylan/chitin deacetylase (PgdA/CDA1 family)